MATVSALRNQSRYRLRGRLPRDGRRLHQGPGEGRLDRRRRRCTRRASTARSSPSDRSPSRTSSSMPCASRWASSSPSGLPKTAEVSVRPAVGALPSITPIGMAALQPGASQLQRRRAGRQARRAHRRRVPSRPRRSKKFAAARVPKLVDVSLDELLSLQPSKLAKKIDGAQVVIVRSQEIDHAGEAGFTFQARQVMDTVIDNLARAIRKLAAAGVEHAVVTADHGHLFFPSDRDESMRIDAPGGDAGRSASPLLDRPRRRDAGWLRPRDALQRSATPPTSILCFPLGSGVFKAGGDLAFHHGGPSLQELVIPVLTVRMKAREPARSTAGPVTATGLPDAVTNRIFSVTIQLDGKNLSLFSNELVVRPLLISAGKQVGAVGMAIDARSRSRDRLREAPAGQARHGRIPVERRERRRRCASSCRIRQQTRSCTDHLTTSRFDLEFKHEQWNTPARDALDDKVEPALRRQGRAQGPRPQGQGRRQRSGLRARVPARKVLRLVRRDGDPDGAAGRQRHAREQLHPPGRVDEGAEQGQGERAGTPSSTR